MADQPKGQECGTCRYFVDLDPGGDSMPCDGYCRRHPPTVVDRNSEYGDSHEELHPMVWSSGWCGEYAPADPQTVTEGAATLARLVLLGDLTAARVLADQLREGE